MNNAFYIGATGMQAQQLNIDTIANNLANVNTVAYKKSRISFNDLVMRDSGRVAPGADADNGLLAMQPKLGAGVGIGAASKMFDNGDMKKTESPLDVAIQGGGFFEVNLPDGSRAYTRGGTLKVNDDGLLATQSGYVLKPGITIPEHAERIVLAADGRVQFAVSGQTGLSDAGQLELVRFASPGQLTAQGDNLYRAGSAAGEPIAARPGEEGLGTLAQGFLENSNVKAIDEMVNLMVAQRAYEASLKLVQASDELAGMVNNIRK